jgi:tetratricopeptide (TPR) repeat protein
MPGDPRAAAHLGALRGEVLAALGEVGAAERALAESAASLDAIGLVVDAARPRQQLAWLRCRQGRLNEAEALAEGQVASDPAVAGAWALLRARAQRYRGQHDEAEALLASMPATASDSLRAGCHLERALLALTTTRTAAARSHLDACSGLLTGTLHRAQAAALGELRVRNALQVANVHGARELFGAAQREVEAAGTAFDKANLGCTEVWLLLVEGDREGAHLRASEVRSLAKTLGASARSELLQRLDWRPRPHA